jgi:hypothetical protein
LHTSTKKDISLKRRSWYEGKEWLEKKKKKKKKHDKRRKEQNEDEIPV